MSRNEITFDDVLDMLMLEVHTPTDEALARWSQRYPQYREELADFFAAWTEQENSTEPEPDTDEDRIVEQSVAYAMDLLRKQGRLASKQPVPTLIPYDQLVLTAIYLLDGKGHPVSITLRVEEMSGKEEMLGTVFDSLNRLETAGLILSRPANPETEPPENLTRRYFTVTLQGDRALASARETSTVVARYLPDFA